MEDIIYVNANVNQRTTLIEINPDNITCKNCGVVGVPAYKYLESNRSVQMLCTECGSWNGNYRYATAETLTMPFGKYKGELLADIPENYLEWLYENHDNLSRNLREAIEDILGA